MVSIRPAHVAGSFYPAQPEVLRATLQHLLDDARAAGDPLAGAMPARLAALIVPHAGYQYSGPIAASAYARLATLGPQLRRIVLLGPAHRLAFSGLAYSEAEAFATPLGTLPVDRAALQELAALGLARPLEAAFAGEHALEVQLPFVHLLAPEAKLVPLLVGDASGAQVARALATVWPEADAPEAAGTLVLISSDLSHFLDQASARTVDAETAAAILALRPEPIGPFQACGCRPIAGLLHEARRRGLTAIELDRRNSGDTAGGRERVVGYGAYAFG